jgi:hypothetical protein
VVLTLDYMVRPMRASTTVMSIIVLVVLILSFQPYQEAHAQTVDQLMSKALAYVNNVLPFDMSQYSVTVDKAYCLPSAPNDATIWQAVDIDLSSSASIIHVVCVYANGSLHQCGVSPTGSPPVSDRSYASMKDVAVRILRAHQEQTRLDSTSLLNILTLVNDSETRSVTLSDISLSISHFPDIVGLQTINGMPVPIASNSSYSVNFDWMSVLNGESYCQVALTFNNGIFHNLQDERAMQPIGELIVPVKEQETTPTPEPIIATQQENSTSPNFTPHPTNGTSTQTNQMPSKSSQKDTDLQNELVIPLLIAAVVVYVIVMIAVFTYKSKNKPNKLESKSQK